MKSFSRRTFLQAAGVSAAAVGFGGVLSACASDSGSGSSDKGATSKSEEHASQVTVSMPVSSEPAAGFDPFVSWGCGEHVHEPLIQSTLLTTTADMGFENDLATAYSCSDDGLTWTFTIRADAKFTNGKALTAHDVAYTINGVADSEASECDLTMVDKAVAVNDETCEIHLNKPFNAFLYTLAVIGIVPDGGHGSDYGTNPIGSGRYMLEQWDHGQQVILKANPDYYGDAPKIDRVVVVFMEEDASLAAARSGQVDVAYTVATYADIHDELRKVFARTPEAKERGYKAGDFSYNTGALRCPTCDGTGTISLDVQFLPDVEIPCPDCGGSRYGREAGLIRRAPKKGGRANTLPELMDMSVDEALAACADLPLVVRRLQVLHDLGLGYLTLGEETPSLSGGEAQRLKLASEMGRGQVDSVFVFDEPTIGLHPLDVKTLLEVFGRLIENGATVIVIEHDLDVIQNADYVIDMGPGGGVQGGRIVAQGTPEEIRQNPDSLTGKYLK